MKNKACNETANQELGIAKNGYWTLGITNSIMISFATVQIKYIGYAVKHDLGV